MAKLNKDDIFILNDVLDKVKKAMYLIDFSGNVDRTLEKIPRTYAYIKKALSNLLDARDLLKDKIMIM